MRMYVRGLAPTSTGEKMKQERLDAEIAATDGWTPEVGDRKTFVPGAWLATGAMKGIFSEISNSVTGEVDAVYPAHRMYRVRYETAVGVKFESFKY